VGTVSGVVAEIFDPTEWTDVSAAEGLIDITYHHDKSGRIARVAFNRPDVRNAFRPHTVDELASVLDDVRMNPRVGVVLLTGNGPSSKDGGWAFCSGGDQRIRGRDGYRYDNPLGTDQTAGTRFMWCVTSRSRAPSTRGRSSFLAREYDAQRAYEMGAVNAVVPHSELEPTALGWVRTILGKSPTAIRMSKFAFNAVDDGLMGQQVFAGEATRLAYGTDEAAEGRDAFLEKRPPDWSPYPWHF